MFGAGTAGPHGITPGQCTNFPYSTTLWGRRSLPIFVSPFIDAFENSNGYLLRQIEGAPSHSCKNLSPSLSYPRSGTYLWWERVIIGLFGHVCLWPVREAGQGPFERLLNRRNRPVSHAKRNYGINSCAVSPIDSSMISRPLSKASSSMTMGGLMRRICPAGIQARPFWKAL